MVKDPCLISRKRSFDYFHEHQLPPGYHRMPLFPHEPFPVLKGKAAKAFLDEMARVDAGISDAEKKDTQNRLWAAMRFLGGKNFPDCTPPV